MKRGISACALAFFLLTPSAFPQQAAVQTEIQQGSEAFQRGDFPAAERHFSDALKIDPTLAQVRANLGLAYYVDHQYGRAVDEFHKALERDPSLRTANSFLPLSLAAGGKCGEAMPGLEREFASNPDVKLRRVLGLSLLRCTMGAGKEMEANETAQKLLAEYPEDADVLYTTGQFYGGLSTAINLKLMKVAPNSPRSYQVMGAVAATDGNWKGAIDAYRKALQLEPAMQGVHLQIAILLLTNSPDPDAWQQALTELNEELKIDPASAQAEYEIGEAYRKHGQLDQAIPAFRKALEIDPSALPVRIALAKALQQLGRKQEALAALQPAQSSEDPGVHFLMSQLLRSLGHTAEAEKEEAEFKRLQKEAPVRFGDGSSAP
jgi:tetratricopeptide (TPR) repeat protein